MKTSDGDYVTADEFIEMVQATMENGGKIDTERLCADCISMVQELSSQVDFAIKVGAALVDLIAGLPQPALCNEMMVKNQQWCNCHCKHTAPDKECCMNYAVMKVRNFDADSK